MIDMKLLTHWGNGRHFADDTFKDIFLNENVIILAKISPKFVHRGPINDIPALVHIMAWRRPGDKPISEPMMVSLLMHICVTRSQWVKNTAKYRKISAVVLGYFIFEYRWKCMRLVLYLKNYKMYFSFRHGHLGGAVVNLNISLIIILHME